MTTASAVLSPKHKSPLKRWLKRVSTVLGIVIGLTVLTTLVSVLTVSSQVGLGSLISEKMLGRSGVADSSLILGRTGTDTELHILGFAPVVSTLTHTALGEAGGITTATLVGRVTSMNGMPSATGYFLWGYSAGALTNTTSTVAISGTGDYSVTITGFNPNNRVYYQFVTDADGTAYGTTLFFLLPSGTGGYLLKNLLRVILAGLILIGVVKFGRTPMTMVVLTVIGLVGFAFISSLIETLL